MASASLAGPTRPRPRPPVAHPRGQRAPGRPRAPLPAVQRAFGGGREKRGEGEGEKKRSRGEGRRRGEEEEKERERRRRAGEKRKGEERRGEGGEKERPTTVTPSGHRRFPRV